MRRGRGHRGQGVCPILAKASRVVVAVGNISMDLDRLDSLARSLASGGSRRRLLSILAAGPVLGGLLGLLDPDDAKAKDRPRRRKQRHKQRKNRGSRKGTDKKTCTPESITRTCAGKCGDVTNNCGTVVDCGSCDCDPPCGECLICEGSPSECLPVLPGTEYGSGPTCADGIEQREDRCDSSGICQDGAPISCDPFRCDGNVCGTRKPAPVV